MYKEKLNKIQGLIEKINSNINLEIILEFLKWCYINITLFFINTQNKYPKQWEIWNIKLWKNIWSEQDWEKTWWYVRPCLVIKSFWVKNDHIIILPLTKSKKPDFISFVLENSKYNFLKFNKSYILLDQIKTISKRRLIQKPLWSISTEDLELIFNKLYSLLKVNKKKF